jgi:amidase
MSDPSRWQEAVRLKRADIAERIAPYALSTLPDPAQKDVSQFLRAASFLTSDEKKVTETDVSTLLSHLWSGEWSAKDVTTAYIKA